MNKAEILKRVFEKNLQIDNEALGFFEKNQSELENFFSKLPSKTDFITLNVVKKALGEPVQIQILKKNDVALRKISVGTTVEFFNKRYSAIIQMFDKKQLAGMMSINKIGPKTKQFSIIALVKEKDVSDKSMLVEDQTAEIKIYFGEELSGAYGKILPDEVVCLLCNSADNEITAKKIFWPDIPIVHDVNKADEDMGCFFISDLHMNDEKFNESAYKKFLKWVGEKAKNKFFLFVLGDVSSDNEQMKNFFNELPKGVNTFFLKGEDDAPIAYKNFLPPDCTVKINDMVLFLSHGNFLENYKKLWPTSSAVETMLELTKKRHLNPVFNFNKKIYDTDPFLLDSIPDILICGHLHEPGILNYKGTTIISNGSFVAKPIFWMINLKTRETIKIDFT